MNLMRSSIFIFAISLLPLALLCGPRASAQQQDK